MQVLLLIECGTIAELQSLMQDGGQILELLADQEKLDMENQAFEQGQKLSFGSDGGTLQGFVL